MLLTENHLDFLSLKGGCTGSSESTVVKMPHCWKSHVLAQFNYEIAQKSEVHTIKQPNKNFVSTYRRTWISIIWMNSVGVFVHRGPYMSAYV